MIEAMHFDCHYYTSENTVMYRSSGTGRKTIWLLYTISLLNWLNGRALRLPKARRAISIVAVLIVLLHSHYICLSLLSVPLQFLPGPLKVISSINSTIFKLLQTSLDLFHTLAFTKITNNISYTCGN